MYKEGTGVSDGLFGYGDYCSEKCRQEDKKARAEGGGSKKDLERFSCNLGNYFNVFKVKMKQHGTQA